MTELIPPEIVALINSGGGRIPLPDMIDVRTLVRDIDPDPRSLIRIEGSELVVAGCSCLYTYRNIVYIRKGDVSVPLSTEEVLEHEASQLPTELRIHRILILNDRSVSGISAETGLSRSTVYRHIRSLSDKLKIRRTGRKTFGVR